MNKFVNMEYTKQDNHITTNKNNNKNQYIKFTCSNFILFNTHYFFTIKFKSAILFPRIFL
ncbi:hypothetical protein HMPREF1144_4418 [Klebsiella sp. OBRC7]|nr:hypothetical protein HMPREF1144_4418 [Klebsiella sp. OBRC7]